MKEAKMLEEDEWVDEVDMDRLPVEQRVDKALVVEINDRPFKVEEIYVEKVVSNVY